MTLSGHSFTFLRIHSLSLLQELSEKGPRVRVHLLLLPGHDLLCLRSLFPLRGLADRSGADERGGCFPVSTDALIALTHVLTVVAPDPKAINEILHTVSGFLIIDQHRGRNTPEPSETRDTFWWMEPRIPPAYKRDIKWHKTIKQNCFPLTCIQLQQFEILHKF